MHHTVLCIVENGEGLSTLGKIQIMAQRGSYCNLLCGLNFRVALITNANWGLKSHDRKRRPITATAIANSFATFPAMMLLMPQLLQG